MFEGDRNKRRLMEFNAMRHYPVYPKNLKTSEIIAYFAIKNQFLIVKNNENWNNFYREVF